MGELIPINRKQLQKAPKASMGTYEAVSIILALAIILALHMR